MTHGNTQIVGLVIFYCVLKVHCELFDNKTSMHSNIEPNDVNNKEVTTRTVSLCLDNLLFFLFFRQFCCITFAAELHVIHPTRCVLQYIINVTLLIIVFFLVLILIVYIFILCCFVIFAFA